MPHRAGLLPRSLLLGGLGLSMLAVVQSDASVEVGMGASTAECDAGFSPSLSAEEIKKSSAFQLPLDGELFQKVDDSRASAISCATYKANFPIEDKFDVLTLPSGDIFASVYDGHGGWQVSEYARKNVLNNVQKEVDALVLPDHNEKGYSKEVEQYQVAGAITRGFESSDRSLMNQVAEAFKLGFGAVARCGSCALVTYLRDHTLYVANAGDIRAVMGKLDASNKNGMAAVALSNDHNAMSKTEQEKLIKLHPGEPNVFTCRHPQSCYVRSALQPTRALGDFALKYSEFNGPPYKNGDRSAGRHLSAPYTPPYITAQPEIVAHELSADDQFLIIGSDGLWDYLTNEEAVQVVMEQAGRGTKELAGRALVDRVLQKAADKYDMTQKELLSLPPGSHRRRKHDDTTVVVLFFDM